MKDLTEPQKEELQTLYQEQIINAARSENIEQLRFYQGKISMIENILNLQKDAFTEDKDEPKN